jgi:formylglycine-generating enzyme required for sulfatase activity
MIKLQTLGESFYWRKETCFAKIYVLSFHYDTSPYDNPQGPASETYRVLRGAGWDGGANPCRVARRIYGDLFDKGSSYGFRIVLDLN